MRISIIGTGYVGLVSGVCLAEKGHKILSVDKDQEKVNLINKAISPIYENGLDVLLKKNLNVNLCATSNLHKSVMETDLSIIAVGTPYNGNEIDLRYIKEVSCEIGKAIADKPTYHMVVVKSTVVPGTTDEVVLPILENTSGKKAGMDFGVGVNPEFLREGEAINDFMCPDRLVLGGMDEKSIKTLEGLYSAFSEIDMLKTNNKTAEMIKYTSNSLLATMISFSNEIGNLCRTIGNVDVVDVMRGVHLDKRLSPIMSNGNRVIPDFTTYLKAGCGFGGSCFPKDVKALIAHGNKFGKPMSVLSAVMKVNEYQPKEVIFLLNKHYSSLKGVNVTILGLAFKPGTDDMRESPAIPIVKELIAQTATIKAYDPVAKREAMKIFGADSIVFCDDLNQAISNADVVLLLTSWKEFEKIPEFLGSLDKPPLLIDGRRMLDKANIKNYEGIGL